MDSFPLFVAVAVTVGQPFHDFRQVERGSSPRRMTVRGLTSRVAHSDRRFQRHRARSLLLITLILSMRRAIRSGATQVARCAEHLAKQALRQVAFGSWRMKYRAWRMGRPPVLNSRCRRPTL